MRIALLSSGAPASGSVCRSVREGGLGAETGALPTDVALHAKALRALGHEVLVLHSRPSDGVDSTFDGEGLTRELGESERPEADRLNAALATFGAEICEIRSTGQELAWGALLEVPLVARQVTSGLVPLARAGRRNLRGVTFATQAMRRALDSEFEVVPNRWVVLDGVASEELADCTVPSDDSELSGDQAESEGELELGTAALRVRILGEVDDRIEALAALAERAPALRFEFEVEEGAAASRVAANRIDARSDSSADITIVFAEALEFSPRQVLRELVSASTLVVEERPVLREFVRSEVDGLGFADAAGLCRALERLIQYPRMRHRLTRSAHKRVGQRFGLDKLTSERVEHYALAAGLRASRSELEGDGSDRFLLDAHNWFDAWWIGGSEPVPTAFRRDADGRIALANGSVVDVQAVHALLVRGWSDGPADWSAAEWTELRSLQEAITDRLSEVRRSESLAAEVEIRWPDLDHALLAVDRDSSLLDEAWRLRDSETFGPWLRKAISAHHFASRAADNLNLRRLAAEAASQEPGQDVFDVLQRIYRDPKRRERVLAEDRDFLVRSEQAANFGSVIEDLGLHTELPRSKFPKTRSRSKSSGAEPRLTILIPSYKHADYIERTLESCLRQSVGDLRILVADDRSPDDTVEVARSLEDERIEVRVNEENLGLGTSVQNALESVTTPFVALLNSDDLFHPERIARCLERFDASPELAVVATRFDVVDRDDRLLSLENACSVEVGPSARGWLRWFGGVTEELRGEADWTDFQTLLRHNVLATSSNMVFRTEWLQERIREAKDLRYCLDWSLFLHASLEQRLGFVDEALLAYRLHDANTVWFQEGDRPDYVIEVNRVLDEALQSWLRRRLDQDGESAAIEELASLLEGAVSGHGETDGLALYLAGSARRQQTDRIDATLQAVEKLASAALRRKAFSQATTDVEIDPWSLGWRIEASDKYYDEHALVERLTTRSQELDRQLRDLTHRFESERSMREDRDREVAHFRFERDQFEQSLERVRKQVTGLEQILERVRMQVTGLEQIRERIRGERDGLEEKRKRLRSDLDRLRERFDELERRQIATSQSLAETTSALERSEDRAEANLSLAEFRGSLLERAVAELAAPIPDVLRRGGRLDRLRAGLWRRAWEFGRILDRNGRHRRRLMVLGLTSPGDQVEEGLHTAGLHELRLTYGDLFRKGDRELRLADDHAVAVRDREYFASRVPDAVQIGDVLAGLDSLGLDRAYRTARVAKARGVGRLVVHGLGREALAALVSRRAAGCSYALILGDDDLSTAAWSIETLREILSTASWVAVDSDTLAQAIRELCPAQKSIQRWVPGPRFVPNEKRSPRSGAIARVLALWDGMHRADPETLLSAVQVLRDRGHNIALDVLVNGGRTKRAVSSRLLLHQLIDEQQLSDCVRLLDGEHESSRAEVWANASLGVWVARNTPRCGLPRLVVEAAWAGLPFLASAADVFQGEWKWLPAGVVPEGRSKAVAEALATHLEDRATLEREARTRRQRLENEWRRKDHGFWQRLRDWSPPKSAQESSD